ncbi:hypothetical protein VPH35_083392 [Triticum aestivum]
MDAEPEHASPPAPGQGQHTEVAQASTTDFYNLRNVDDAAKAPKKEQRRASETHIQNKRLRLQNRRVRKQSKREEAQEVVDRALKLREEMLQERLAFEASAEGKEEAEKYRSTPPWSWRPAVPFGRESVLKCASWSVEEFTLELAQCVVGLQSFIEDRNFFSCSGTIVEFLEGVGHVVTSASLVKLPHQDEIADKLKINVFLASGEIFEGLVSNVDFCYNICVVEVRSTSMLATKKFSADSRIFNFNEYHSRDVVALGCLCEPWSLNVASGKLIPRRSQLDCEELLVSSCRISKFGGILLDMCGQHILERQKLGLPEDYNQMSTLINLKFDMKTQRGRKSEKTTRTINIDKFTPSGKLNRWPLGRAYLLRRIENGILYSEERYG